MRTPSPRVTGHRLRRSLATAAVLALSSGLLTACGGDSGKTVTWYVNPDGFETLTAIAERCSEGKDYTIDVRQLPTDATQQRVQVVRRLAAEDPSIDIMSLDPVFVPELANAGFLAEWPDDLASKVVDDDVLQGPADTVTWEDKVYAAPQWANTQVLWYNKALAEKGGLDLEKSDEWTWEQIIDAAEKGGGTVGVQANKYEAYVVWINALIEGAGGHIVSDTEAGEDAKVELDSEAGKAAAEVISKLASSDAAQSDLTTSNEGTSLGFMFDGSGEFMVNWTFAYANYAGTEDKKAMENLGWARYPRTVAGEESKPPIGGIDIGVNEYSDTPEEAMEAAQCVSDADAQKELAVTDGLMPVRQSVYDSPELKKAVPADLLELFQQSLESGGPRPKSAYYSVISGAMQNSWHPPTDVSADTTPGDSAKYLDEVLQGKALQ